MKRFLKSRILAVILTLAVVAAAAAGAYSYWLEEQPKFQDVTVELGTDVVKIEQFLTEYADPGKVTVVSDVSQIDLNRAGDTQLVFRHGKTEETVVLHVVDTTNPTAAFVTELTVPVDYVFDVRDFVTNVDEFSNTEIAFLGSAAVPVDYSDITVTVEVTDASGNAVRQDCRVSFSWLKETATLELGKKLSAKDLLYMPERDSALLDSKELEAINQAEPGVYTISSTSGGKTMTCTVTVQDTRAPELLVQNFRVKPGNSCSVEDFVVSADDASGDVELRMVTEPDVDTLGIQTVVIEAQDRYGNVARQETLLAVTKDHKAPDIVGMFSMTLEKNSDFDFMEGVRAIDNQDENCTITVDVSGINMSVGGTYYAIYTATDASLNTVTEKRKITIIHDEEDVKNLVNSIAAQLSDDPEEIRDYVRTIRYSSSWGEDDPVWYGFTKGKGNCYVHAHCLKALFDAKGIESQIIWVTEKTHYWLVVKIGDVWRHIDATPTPGHMRYSLMNDEERHKTLSGRNWNRSLWPACE